jgi:hypothetical protein
VKIMALISYNVYVINMPVLTCKEYNQYGMRIHRDFDWCWKYENQIMNHQLAARGA